MRVALLLGLAGCAVAPYPDYFEPEGGPTVVGVSPPSVPDALGGQEVVIEGTGLETARTVVFGNRNATILEATDTAVRVQVPAFAAMGGDVEVAVVTDEGIGRRDEAFTYAVPDADWFADEVVSAALVRLDCPVEAAGWYEGDAYPVWWCGFDLGEAWGEGWIGDDAQPGVAGDLAGLVPVSALPPVGEMRVVVGEAASVPRPKTFGARSGDEVIAVTTPRRFEDQVAFGESMLVQIEDTYTFWDDVTDVDGPYISLFDAESCWVDDVYVEDAAGDTLTLSLPADETTTGVWLSWGITEDFDGEEYLTELLVSTARGQGDGFTFTGEPAGTRLVYDDYSGTFYTQGVLGAIGRADLPPGAEYEVVVERLGESSTPQAMTGGAELVVTAPDLASGQVDIDRAGGLLITWDPHTPGADPSYLGVEIVVYDPEVPDPNGWAEVARLVARGDDATGRLVIPPSVLGQLPTAGNGLTFEDDFEGRWAELTVARHQLRKVEAPDAYEGDVVVDFVHAVQSPVRLR